MCNHYRNDPEKLPTWREYAGYDLRQPNEPWADDVYPKRHGLIVRREDGRTFADVQSWGVPTKIKGKSGKMLDRRVTNVRNLSSSFWRSMLATPAQRCLVPFSTYAEPKAGMGREEWWFSIPDQPVAAFAGIWRNTEHGKCYAFLTTGYSNSDDPEVEATAAAAHIVGQRHPKAMPVILDPSDYEQWLSGSYEDACALSRAYPSERMAVL